MHPNSSINIYTGWTQKWTSSERLKKNKYINVHEIVRGPFSSPRLMSTQPFITFSSYQRQENYSDVRRGIPDTWKEYLISKGFCTSTEAYVLQKNLIPFCTRYFITDKLWNDTRLPFIQGIPDPWKTRTLHRSQSNKYSRLRFSRTKNICSRRFACVYDGDDEAEIECGVPCQFNKDHIDDKKDPSQEGHKESNYSLIERTFKDNLDGVREKGKRCTNQLSFKKDSKLSNRKKSTEKMKHDQYTEIDIEKTHLKSREINSNKNLNKHARSKYTHHKTDQLKDKKQFASKNDSKSKTITKKEVQTTSKKVADGITQTSIILKDKIDQVQESFPRKHIEVNTQMYPNNIVCCNCILHSYILPSMHCFCNCTSPLKDASLSNRVLCQECENIYCRRKSEKLISPAKKLEFCTPDPKRYAKHKQRVYMKREKIYKWTKQKLCTCMQKVRKQFEEQNRLDNCIQAKDAIFPKQELKLMCYYCNSPDLKIEKIFANTPRRNTCIFKKASNRLRNEQNKIRDYVTKHSITKSRRNFIRGSKKRSYTCIGNKRHISKCDLDWTSPSMSAKWGHNVIKRNDCEFSKKNGCNDEMLKVETERTRIDKETKRNESTQTLGNIVTDRKGKGYRKEASENYCCNVINENKEMDKQTNIMTNEYKEIEAAIFQHSESNKLVCCSVSDSGENADVSDNTNVAFNTMAQYRPSVTSITFIKRMNNLTSIKSRYLQRNPKKACHFRRTSTRGIASDFGQNLEIEGKH